ncbi:HNH endonuclease family protein [Albibacterium indicum]|uniref:hypothetical protein n=1 Tax=Albibacterium indicum TaxID=2292082 RepID=UPI000E4C3563|nr:hypothetical protein [Pedobacter indicus]
MISIRECLNSERLDQIRATHTDFVVEEIDKRIDFYSHLFSWLLYNQNENNIPEDLIRTEVNNGIVHHKQAVSLIKKLFNNEHSFTRNSYGLLASPEAFKNDALNYQGIIACLDKLKSKSRSIVNLDFTTSTQASRYYTLSKSSYQPLLFLIPAIFDYGWFSRLGPGKKWGPYQLIANLEMRVCPYCNQQYTFSVSRKRKKITRAELDHFLPREQHPLLALSFFNLIPSCTVCNRNLKGRSPFSYDTHFSPYEQNEKHGFLYFDYEPTSYLGAVGESDDITIKVIKDPQISSSRIKAQLGGNLEIFKHDILINEHKDVVQEIIRKRHISNDSYIETLIKTFPGAKLNYEEAYRLAYGNFYDECYFNKRPLAKLTRDIADKLGALKPF